MYLIPELLIVLQRININKTLMCFYCNFFIKSEIETL